MDYNFIIEELLRLLEGSGIQIRRESMGGTGGGVCRLKNKTVLFLDIDAPPAEKARQCAEAVIQTTDVDSVYLKPLVRDYIDGLRGDSFDTL